MKFLFTILIALMSSNAFAQQLLMHGPSDTQVEAMSLNNAQAAREIVLGPVGGPRAIRQSFHEYDHTEYVVMSDDDFGGTAADMKKDLAAGMPADATLIIFTSSNNKSYQQNLMNEYSQYISASRLKIMQVPVGGDGFWARDGLPIPVWEDGKLALADNKYYHGYEPDAFYGTLFDAKVTKTNYFFEGGNFMVNGKGDCLVVNRKKAYFGGTSDTAAIPDDIFKNVYGCKTLTRFKHLKGIGHADEVVKFVNDTTVLTDTPEYKQALENAGFTVVMLPEPDLNYETYANSLIVNDTVFVPVFGETGDQEALDTYASYGFKVVPIQSRGLATGGQGGIHCITMNYPAVTLHDIVQRHGVLNIIDTVSK